jgi:hypothetical protein
LQLVFGASVSNKARAIYQGTFNPVEGPNGYGLFSSASHMLLPHIVGRIL